MQITYENTKETVKLTTEEELGLIQNLQHQMKANHVDFPIFQVFVKVNETHDFFSVVVCSMDKADDRAFDFEAWKVSQGDYGFDSSFFGIYSES